MPAADASVILCMEELLLVSEDPRWEGGSGQPDLGRSNVLVSEDIPNPLPSKVWEAAEGHSEGVCEAYLVLVSRSPSKGLGNFSLFENLFLVGDGWPCLLCSVLSEGNLPATPFNGRMNGYLSRYPEPTLHSPHGCRYLDEGSPTLCSLSVATVCTYCCYLFLTPAEKVAIYSFSRAKQKRRSVEARKTVHHSCSGPARFNPSTFRGGGV